MSNITFTGFSTSANRSAKRAWVLTDRELIRQDLLNHFYTKLGERVMRPTFGSRLYEFIMEPNVEQVQSSIFAEVERIINLDPRLGVSDLRLHADGHFVIISMTLYYRPFQSTEAFRLEFDTRQTF